MDFVETEGETIDDAIENALKLLGVERDKITVDIYRRRPQGNPGFRFAESANPGHIEKAAARRKRQSRKRSPQSRRFSAWKRLRWLKRRKRRCGKFYALWA